jgi:hypothetical protein
MSLRKLKTNTFLRRRTAIIGKILAKQSNRKLLLRIVQINSRELWTFKGWNRKQRDKEQTNKKKNSNNSSKPATNKRLGLKLRKRKARTQANKCLLTDITIMQIPMTPGWVDLAQEESL